MNKNGYMQYEQGISIIVCGKPNLTFFFFVSSFHNLTEADSKCVFFFFFFLKWLQTEWFQTAFMLSDILVYSVFFFFKFSFTQDTNVANMNAMTITAHKGLLGYKIYHILFVIHMEIMTHCNSIVSDRNKRVRIIDMSWN